MKLQKLREITARYEADIDLWFKDSNGKKRRVDHIEEHFSAGEGDKVRVLCFVSEKP